MPIKVIILLIQHNLFILLKGCYLHFALIRCSIVPLNTYATEPLRLCVPTPLCPKVFILIFMYFYVTQNSV
jgi:hypothetical protein